MADSDHAGRDGALVLLFVSAVYTLILAAFLLRGYPAAARSALGVAPDEQYRLQVWYQAPLFFLATALTAAVLSGLARVARQPARYSTVFARISLATAVPFALTTMLVESAAALVLVGRVIEPPALLGWLAGDGAWFAALYQAAGLAWLAALVVLATRVTLGRGWWAAAVVAVPLLVVYGLPVALFVR